MPGDRVSRWGERAMLLLLSGLAAGCASVRDLTLPATDRPVYSLQVMSVRPPRDPAWRLINYNPWSGLIFHHADTNERLAAWWVPISAEEARHFKAETVVTFFRDDFLNELKLSGDFTISDSEWAEGALQAEDRRYAVISVTGLEGEKQVPFEAWVAYRATGTNAQPQMEVFSYARPRAGPFAARAPNSSEDLSALTALVQSVTPIPSRSWQIPWQRASALYERFLERHAKRTIAEEQSRLRALYETAHREAKDAASVDPNRPALHDLLGLLACYNAQLDFLGEGFDAAAAEREFRKAIQLRPNFALAHEHLARLLRTQERVQDAIAEFDTLIEISPSVANYYYERAKLLEKVGRSSDALNSYRQALRFWIGAAQTKKELEEKVRVLEKPSS